MVVIVVVVVVVIVDSIWVEMNHVAEHRKEE